MKVKVQVKPGSKKGPLVQPGLMGELLVFLREPAVEGKANNALVRLLSDYYEVPKSSVTITAGRKSRRKIVEIEGL